MLYYGMYFVSKLSFIVAGVQFVYIIGLLSFPPFPSSFWNSLDRVCYSS